MAVCSEEAFISYASAKSWRTKKSKFKHFCSLPWPVPFCSLSDSLSFAGQPAPTLTGLRLALAPLDSVWMVKHLSSFIQLPGPRVLQVLGLCFCWQLPDALVVGGCLPLACDTHVNQYVHQGLSYWAWWIHYCRSVSTHDCNSFCDSSLQSATKRKIQGH